MHVDDETGIQRCSDFYPLVYKKDECAFLIRNVLLYLPQNSCKGCTFAVVVAPWSDLSVSQSGVPNRQYLQG